jgi:hypothetical protein
VVAPREGGLNLIVVVADDGTVIAIYSQLGHQV